MWKQDLLGHTHVRSRFSFSTIVLIAYVVYDYDSVTRTRFGSREWRDLIDDLTWLPLYRSHSLCKLLSLCIRIVGSFLGQYLIYLIPSLNL